MKSKIVVAVITLLYAKYALSFFDFISVEEVLKWLSQDDEADYYFDEDFYDDNNETSDEDEADILYSSSTFPTDSTTIPGKPPRPYKQACGRQLVPFHRIVGGSNATFGRIPMPELQLRMGELDITSPRGPRRLVDTVITHPNFDRPTLEYDLALLRFDTPVVFQPNVIPICLPDNNETYIGRTAFVTGWGALKEAGGPLATTLQEVSLPVMDNKICEILYKSSGYDQSIPNIFICAGLRKGGRDACQGDSGGPMVIQRPDKRFLLAGIASWGGVCGAPNEPGVYTRVSTFRHWIEEIINT
ncbi:hypothetical protein RP20_CCG017662 [Aedes albopictus]|nr:hypothetical protein RP20_CCG017662 [Aedes albopictus]